MRARGMVVRTPARCSRQWLDSNNTIEKIARSNWPVLKETAELNYTRYNVSLEVLS
jgi:hypothetical protein